MSTVGNEFANSTHAKYWIFTKEKLKELREEARLTVHVSLNFTFSNQSFLIKYRLGSSQSL